MILKKNKMQNKRDSNHDDEVWVEESIETGDLSTTYAIQLTQDEDSSTLKQGGDLSTLSVQREPDEDSVEELHDGDLSNQPIQTVQHGKLLECHAHRVGRSRKEEQQRKVLVCLSTIVAMVIDGSYLRAFGTLFIDIMEEFQTTRASTAVIQSLLVGVCQGTVLSDQQLDTSLHRQDQIISDKTNSYLFLYQIGVLCGALVTRFGPRTIGLAGEILVSTGMTLAYFANRILMLDLTVGVILGLGLSFLYISNATVIGMSFKGSSKVLVLSLACAGGGIGGLSSPFLLRYLREKYGLQETFLIFGGFGLNTIPCTLLWGAPTTKDVMNNGDEDKTRTKPELHQECAEKKANHSLQIITELFRNAPYMLFILGNMCTNAPLTMYTILITDIYDQKGFGKSGSTFGISLMNIFGLFGRLAPGLLKQIPKYSALYTSIFCCVLGAILMTSVNLTISLEATLVVSAGLGFAFGVFLSTVTVTTVSLIGPTLFPSGVGMMCTMNGVTNLAIGPVSGLVKDVTQSYESVLYGATVLMACGCVSFSVAFWIRRRKRQRKIVD